MPTPNRLTFEQNCDPVTTYFPGTLNCITAHTVMVVLRPITNWPIFEQIVKKCEVVSTACAGTLTITSAQPETVISNSITNRLTIELQILKTHVTIWLTHELRILKKCERYVDCSPENTITSDMDLPKSSDTLDSVGAFKSLDKLKHFVKKPLLNQTDLFSYSVKFYTTSSIKRLSNSQEILQLLMCFYRLSYDKNSSDCGGNSVCKMCLESMTKQFQPRVLNDSTTQSEMPAIKSITTFNQVLKQYEILNGIHKVKGIQKPFTSWVTVQMLKKCEILHTSTTQSGDSTFEQRRHIQGTQLCYNLLEESQTTINFAYREPASRQGCVLNTTQKRRTATYPPEKLGNFSPHVEMFGRSEVYRKRVTTQTAFELKCCITIPETWWLTYEIVTSKRCSINSYCRIWIETVTNLLTFAHQVLKKCEQTIAHGSENVKGD